MADPFGGDDPIAATARYEAWMARHFTVDAAALRLKRERMREDPFAFLRGSFYRWAWHCRELPKALRQAPVVRAIGDVHLENFGTWRDAEGRLAWGVNDFDEAAPLPFAVDLVRLAASALLEAERLDGRSDGPTAVDAVLGGYRDGIAGGGRPFILEAEHAMLRDLATVSGEAGKAFWAALGSGPKVEAVAETTPGLPAALLRGALPPDATAPRFFRRRAGLGSLGRPRFLVLATWRGGPIAREAKAALPSAATPDASDANEAARWLQAYAIRAPDPLLLFPPGWVLRRLSPEARKIEIGEVERAGDQRRLLRAMGFEVANVHLGTPGAGPAIGAALAALDREAGWLRAAAEGMARRVKADHEAFQRGSRRGG